LTAASRFLTIGASPVSNNIGASPVSNNIGAPPF
jgi:hypothetical protein